MDSHLKNINSYWAYLLIEELIRNKVDTFFISPGSRSTPLTLAVAENKKADKIICFDERAAAFAALGYARAANKPAVLICTSGTAAANYYPAVIEAKQSHIPMILLTADRPPELRDTGANQTIRQTEMFGSYPNWQFEMPCPTTEIPSAMVLTTIDQAVFRANNPVAGPVHLNCMFREPLAPTAGPLPKSYLKQAVVWKKSTNPYTAYLPPEIAVAQDEADKILHLFNGTRKGLLVVGELNDIATQKAVISLAEKLKWPVFADITSGVRQAGALLPNMEYYDLLLLSDKVQKILNPQVILHLGRPVTSKRFLQFQQNYPAGEYIQVSDSTDRHDPNHRVTRRVYSDVSQFCLRIAAALNGTSDKKWFVAVNEKNSLIRRIMEDRFSGQVEVSEIAAARFIAQSLPEKHGLFLASSMPVRDFDMYSGLTSAALTIASNRGASGIDGTLASAIGYARGTKKPVTLFIGDLALIHDINSLDLVNDPDICLTIVVINNRGGGIFSFLPVSAFNHVFEKYFATPHSYDFKGAAAMFKIGYQQPRTMADFERIYKKNIRGKKSVLIELQTDRNETLTLHKNIQRTIKNALEK